MTVLVTPPQCFDVCHPCNEGGIAFSHVRLCQDVCLCSVNMITAEPLEISSQNVRSIILGSKFHGSVRSVKNTALSYFTWCPI